MRTTPFASLCHLTSRVLFGLFLGLSWCSPSLAITSEAVLQIQQSLESRMLPVVRGVDPHALALVKVKMKKKEAYVAPSSGFLFRDLNSAKPDAQAEMEIERVEVLVLSAKPNFPKSVLALVKDMSSGVGPVSLRVRRLPKELDAVEHHAATHAAAAAVATPAAAVVAKPAAAQPAAGMFTRWFRQDLAIPFLSMEVVALFAAFLVFWGFRSGTGELHNLVQNGFSALAAAVENTGTNLDTRLESLSDAFAGENNRSNETAHKLPAAELIAGMPDDGLFALLTDCYWGEFDSYAAFVWKRIPMGRRPALLSRADFLSEYSASLLHIPETALGAEQEPYYLSPLPIGHLDNTALTELVKKTPALKARLSTVRVAGLCLSAQERVELSKHMSDTLMAMPDFAQMAPSSRRAHRRAAVIPIRTIQEEREILALPDLSLDLMQSIPTLGWWLKLPRERLIDALERFSARDLAAAWVGPEEVLRHLGQALPERKLKLVHNYARMHAGSRQSAAFQTLHRGALELLEADARYTAAQHMAA